MSDEVHSKHTNRLAGETSPYLLQHAHNPVDWYPWGEEALSRARTEDKPIFLSIGYAACHWCHVMERESFEDEVTAAELNRDFVPIKVDREERPDLDQVYMAAVQAMTGSGGWPMSVFLTPDGRPFYGGTYFPDDAPPRVAVVPAGPRGRRQAWRERARRRSSGPGPRSSRRSPVRPRSGRPADRRWPGRCPIGRCSTPRSPRSRQSFDPRHGGWGGAPKFPQPMTIEFLLRRAAAGADDGRSLAMARRTLDAMAAGGIHDQLGGGFPRYATDAVWLVPHFEKMLYDNAQLARVYVHAWQLTGDAPLSGRGARHARLRGARAADRRRWVRREPGCRHRGRGGRDVRLVAPRRSGTCSGPTRPLFDAAYDVTDDGNWEGQSRSSAACARTTSSRR